MIKFIDDFLNRITMYRLVLYFLLILLAIAVIFSFLNILPFNPWFLLVSIVILLAICFLVNLLFSKIFKAPVNNESFFITALILALIITPPVSLTDVKYLVFITWVAVWAMASKYILAINKKHIFNPAAFAVALTALTISQSASWWIGTASMMPFVLLGGLLVTRKLKRFDLVFTFIGISLAITSIVHAQNLSQIPKMIEHAFLASPLLFFAFVMLTEPLTTPPTKDLRMVYAVFVGAIFDPIVHIGNIFSTPELSLLVGNVFSYIVSPKKKLILKLKEKEKVAKDTYNFSFISNTKGFKFKPGQYLEWTLGHSKSDNRGNRRYFTITSSPSEKEIKIGVKFYPKPSSFKQTLANMKVNEIIVASQLSGEFTLPDDTNKKLCFLAGGIGITPFRSMIIDMLEKNQKRDIKIFYSNNTIEDIAYREIFDKANNELGIETFYTLAIKDLVPPYWQGERGFITAQMIENKMPDYKERMYYISGPRTMVETFKKILNEMGIHKSHIKVDFFPGFA